MNNKLTISISDCTSTKQYSLPSSIKTILFVFVVLWVLITFGLVYYVLALNSKVDTLEQVQNLKTEKSLNSSPLVEKSQHETSLLDTGSTAALVVKQNALLLHEKENNNSKRREKLAKLKKIKEEKARLDKKIADKKAKEEAQALEEKKKKDAARKKKLAKLKKIQKEKAAAKKEEAKKKKSLKEKLKKLKEKKTTRKQEAKKTLVAKNTKKRSKKSTSSKSKLLPIAKNKLGRRYVWGAVGPKVFDCSGFTSYVYKKVGYRIPRTSRQQSKYGKRIKRSNLKPGDLIFFDTSRRRKNIINHVGMYIGNNKFIHASSAKKRVIITSLKKKFYSNRYKWARRIIN